MLKMWASASDANRRDILQLVEQDRRAMILDLGCGKGDWTIQLSKGIGVEESSAICGIEIDRMAAKLARKNHVNVCIADLNYPLPFSDKCMDVIHANRVIEHLSNVDLFLDEISRVLKPGGYVIISTENLSSTANLVSIALGQQAFSQHISRLWFIGNRFSPHHGELVPPGLILHKTVFSYFGLREMLEYHRLRVEKILSIGYFPFPHWLSRLDPIHGHFMVFKARKTEVRSSNGYTR
jgi:SAM-dependent methyltransferase